MLRKLLIISVLLASSQSAWALFTWLPETGWSKDWESVASTDMEQYTNAYDALEAHKYKKAASGFSLLQKYYPDSRLVEKSMYYEAVALLKNKDLWKAFSAFEKYIKNYPESSFVKEAFAHQFDIAKSYQLGAKRALPLTSWKIIPAKEDAITIYEKIIKQDPFGAFGARAQFEIALIYEDIEDYDAAIDAYNLVIDHYMDTTWATKARFRKSIVFQAMNKGADYNKKPLRQAIENLTIYEATLSDEKERQEIKQTINDINKKALLRLKSTADYYKRISKPKAAIIYYQKIIKKFPNSAEAQEAKKQIDLLKVVK